MRLCYIFQYYGLYYINASLMPTFFVLYTTSSFISITTIIRICCKKRLMYWNKNNLLWWWRKKFNFLFISMKFFAMRISSRCTNISKEEWAKKIILDIWCISWFRFDDLIPMWDIKSNYTPVVTTKHRTDLLVMLCVVSRTYMPKIEAYV